MPKRFRRMTKHEIAMIVAELDRWAMGQLGSKLTWSILEERYGFSRQSLQAKPEIKAAYDNAKHMLSGKLVKTAEQTGKENEELLCENRRLKNELDTYKSKELRWLQRWQRIAFHVRQKGIQMESVDREPPGDAELPSSTESAQILRPFNKDIPPSGRT